MRDLFAHEAPRWVECRTGLAEQWSACEAVLEGHTNDVLSAAFSADGRRVVSASADRTVRLWDAQTGTCEAILEGHTSWVWSAAFSADGRHVVSASRDKTVRLWDTQTGTCDAILEGHANAVFSAAFSADGRRVVSASDDKTVRLWDSQTGICEATYDVGGTSSVSFDSAGMLIHTDARILRINHTMQLPPGRHSPRSADPYDYGLSPDRVWVQRQSQPILWLPPEYRPRCSAVTIADGGISLVLGCESGRVYLFHFSPL